MESSLISLRLRMLNLYTSNSFRILYFDPIRCLLESSLRNRSPCFITTCSLVTSKKKEDDDSKNKQDKKKFKSSGPKILLETETGKLTSLYLEDAEKLAKKKKLQLLNLESIGKKNTYKLTGASEILKAETKKIAKTSKKFIFNTDSNEHDLKIKLNKVADLLDRNKKIVVSVEDNANKLAVVESIVATIENEFKNKVDLKKLVKKKNRVVLQLSPNATETQTKTETEAETETETKKVKQKKTQEKEEQQSLNQL